MIKTEKYYFDVVVIGAGIIGIATSLEHAKKGLQVLLVEKNPTFGQGVSSRNSEVIHAGIYYPQNSLNLLEFFLLLMDVNLKYENKIRVVLNYQYLKHQ